MNVADDPQNILERAKQLLHDSKEGIEGKIVKNHIILDVVGEDVHYWSPQLNFRVDEDEVDANNAVVSGLIGPRPEVWTLFMFFYFLIGALGFVISSYAVSKLLLNEFSYLIFAFPIAIVIMLTAYKAGKYGEQLAADQIEDMKHFVRKVIDTANKNA